MIKTIYRVELEIPKELSNIVNSDEYNSDVLALELNKNSLSSGCIDEIPAIEWAEFNTLGSAKKYEQQILEIFEKWKNK